MLGFHKYTSLNPKNTLLIRAFCSLKSLKHNSPLHEPTKRASPRLKTKGDFKLKYTIKRAVTKDLQVLIVKINCWHVYDITLIVAQKHIKVGGNEIGAGNTEVLGFVNTPES